MTAIRATALAFALAACGGAPAEEEGDRMLGRAGAEQEYRAAAQRLTLPQGAAFPESLPQTREATIYEPGYATSLAENFWICAWTKEWLAHRFADSARAAKAFAEVEKAPQTQFMTKHLDEPGRRFFSEYLSKARLGDPSGLQQYTTQNCAGS